MLFSHSWVLQQYYTCCFNLLFLFPPFISTSHTHISGNLLPDRYFKLSNSPTVRRRKRLQSTKKTHVGFPNRLYLAVKHPKLPKGPIPLYKLIRIKRTAQFQSKGPSSFRFEDGPFSQTVPFSRLNNHWETF